MDIPYYFAATMTLLVALACTSLGALAGARRPAVALVSGWGIAALTLTAAGTLTPLRLDLVLIALGLLALAGSIRLPKLDWRYTLPVLCLGAPYLLIATRIMPSGFDEYSHWLPNILYLDRYNHFPALHGPEPVSIRPGYPYGLAFIALAVSRLTGTLAETAIINWNALLNLALASMACELLAICSDVMRRWRLAAIALLGCGVLSPVFVPKLYLSNYGDAICGQVAGIMAAVILLQGVLLQRWQTGLRLGFVLAALVSIRQDAFSIAAILMIAWGILQLWQSRARPPVQALAGFLCAFIAPILIWWLWQRYQTVQIGNGAAEFLSWQDERWADLPAILHSILIVFSHKLGYALLLVLTVWAGLCGRRIPRTIRTSALFGALLGWGHVASMVAVYLSVITGGESVRVAPEFWRFSQHIAPAVMLCALPLLLLSEVFRTVLQKDMGRFLPPFAVLVLCAAYPFLRVDAHDSDHISYRWLRSLANDVASTLPSGAQLAIIETEDLPGKIQQTFCLRYRYLAQRPDTAPSSLFLVGGTPPQTVVIAHALPQLEAFHGLPTTVTDVVVTSGSPLTSSVMSVSLPAGSAYLLHRQADGHFTVVRSWKRPA